MTTSVGTTGTAVVAADANAVTIAVGIPVLTAFAGATAASTAPTLDWSDVTDAVTYTLQYANDGAFTVNPVTVTGITTSQFTFPAPLADGTYFWRVKTITCCRPGGVFGGGFVRHHPDLRAVDGDRNGRGDGGLSGHPFEVDPSGEHVGTRLSSGNPDPDPTSPLPRALRQLDVEDFCIGAALVWCQRPHEGEDVEILVQDPRERQLWDRAAFLGGQLFDPVQAPEVVPPDSRRRASCRPGHRAGPRSSCGSSVPRRSHLPGWTT